MQNDNNPERILSRRGMPWTEDEEKRLLEFYYNGSDIDEITEKHRRTVGAIVARLAMLTGMQKDTFFDEFDQDLRGPLNRSSDDHISIAELIKRLRRQTQTQVQYIDVASWLVKEGALELVDDDGKTRLHPTFLGAKLGVHYVQKGIFMGNGRTYEGIILDKKGQALIYDHLTEILSFKDSSNRELEEAEIAGHSKWQAVLQKAQAEFQRISNANVTDLDLMEEEYLKSLRLKLTGNRQAIPSDDAVAKTIHSESDLFSLVGEQIVLDMPGFGKGEIINVSPSDTTGKYDYLIGISFENGKQINSLLSICSKNPKLKFTSASVSRKELFAFVEKRQCDYMKELEKKEQERKAREAQAREEQKKRIEKQREMEQIARQKEREAAILAERKNAYRYLTEERGVEYFIHYTPIANLQSIIDHGIIPRNLLGESNINAVTPDKERIDDRLDCTSLSISFPNYLLLWKQRIKGPSFAILLIDPSILEALHDNCIYFLPDNAASFRNAHFHYSGLDSLRNLFADRIMTNKGYKTRKELGLPYCFPTNPQAEVFMSGIIPTEFIRGIRVENYKTLKELRPCLRLPTDSEESFLDYDAKLFSYRCDWDFWKKNATSEM